MSDISLFFFEYYQPANMAIILAAAGALFTYIPGIRAKDFGIRSQQKQGRAALQERLKAGAGGRERGHERAAFLSSEIFRTKGKSSAGRKNYNPNSIPDSLRLIV